MASRNGIKQAITSPREDVAEDDRGYLTAAQTIAHEHPTPREENLDWRCAGYANPEVFTPSTPAAYAEAIALCGGCPMRQVCGDLGQARGEYGVWGGQMLAAGKVRAAPKAAGRPRKVDQGAVAVTADAA